MIMIFDSFRIDLSEHFNSSDIVFAKDLTNEGTKNICLKKVKSQRHRIEEAMSKLKEDESIQNFNLYDIERQLIENLNDKEFTRYKKLMSKLENMTNLLFGLEIRLNEKKICNSKEGLVMLMYQIKNAQEVLDELEKNLKQFSMLLNTKLNSKFSSIFSSFLSKKQHNIALRKALVRELYFIHMKFDIINLM